MIQKRFQLTVVISRYCFQLIYICWFVIQLSIILFCVVSSSHQAIFGRICLGFWCTNATFFASPKNIYTHTNHRHLVFFDQSNGTPKANAQITPWLKIDWRLLWLDNFSSVDPSASSSHDENWNWTSQQQPNRLDTNKDEEEMTKCKQKPFDLNRNRMFTSKRSNLFSSI